MLTKKSQRQVIEARTGNRQWFQKWHTAYSDWKADVRYRHLRIFEYYLAGSNAERRAWCSLIVGMWSRNYKMGIATEFWHQRVAMPQRVAAMEIAKDLERPDQWHQFLTQPPAGDWRYARRYRERFQHGNREVGTELRMAIVLGHTLDLSGLPEGEQVKMANLIALIRKDTQHYEGVSDKNRKELQQSLLHRFNFRPRRKTAMEIVQVLDCVHGIGFACDSEGIRRSGVSYEFARSGIVAAATQGITDEVEKASIRKADRESWPFTSATTLLERGWIDLTEFTDRVVQHAASIAGRKCYKNIWMPDMTTDPHAAKSMPKARMAKIGEFASEIAAEYFLRYSERGASSWLGATKGALRKMGRQWNGKPLETYGVADGGNSRTVSKRELARLAGVNEKILDARRKQIPGATENQLQQGGVFTDRFGVRVHHEPLPALYTVKETIRHLADAPYVNPDYLDPSEIGKYVELANLSRSERQVFEFVQRGKTTTQIATILGIPDRTVRYNVASATQKMQQVVAAA